MSKFKQHELETFTKEQLMSLLGGEQDTLIKHVIAEKFSEHIVEARETAPKPAKTVFNLPKKSEPLPAPVEDESASDK